MFLYTIKSKVWGKRCYACVPVFYHTDLEQDLFFLALFKPIFYTQHWKKETLFHLPVAIMEAWEKYPLFWRKAGYFYAFLVHLNFDVKIRHLETLPEHNVQLHINTCRLMPQLPKISRHFLTAVSRVHSAKNTKERKGPGQSRLFFDFFRHFLFSLSAFFAKSRIARTDHWFTMLHKTLSVSAISNQVSRCCINFPHELTCQLLTNQNIKIGRRAWPTRDHGEKGQKQLPCL